MLACSVEELEVDKCRRAGWRSGTSFRGASSFSAEQLVSKHHTSRRAWPQNCLCLCRDQICFRPAARLPERGSRRPRLPHDDVMSQIHREQGAAERDGRGEKQQQQNHQPSSVTMTFAARHLQTRIHIALRLRLSEQARTQTWPPSTYYYYNSRSR